MSDAAHTREFRVPVEIVVQVGDQDVDAARVVRWVEDMACDLREQDFSPDIPDPPKAYRSIEFVDCDMSALDLSDVKVGRPDWIVCVAAEGGGTVCGRPPFPEFRFANWEHADGNRDSYGRLVTCPDCEKAR